VLVRPGRDRLTGTVEVDETYIGGGEPGLRGGRAKDKKALVGVAVEVLEPRGFGQARMQVLADGSAATLHPFVTAHVEPGARVITDGWTGYRGIAGPATPTSPAVNVRPAPAATTPASCSPVSTGSRRWPSAGCWAPTKVRSRKRICRATSTSSSSGSTDAARAAEAWSSTGCSNSPPLTPGAPPRAGRQPAAEASPSQAAGRRRPPAEHGPPSGGATLESALTCDSPVS